MEHRFRAGFALDVPDGWVVGVDAEDRAVCALTGEEHLPPPDLTLVIGAVAHRYSERFAEAVGDLMRRRGTGQPPDAFAVGDRPALVYDWTDGVAEVFSVFVALGETHGLEFEFSRRPSAPAPLDVEALGRGVLATLRWLEPGAPVVEVVDGDLLDQPVEVIVNAWNRNVIPWWLLLPQGVSGAIKRRGGLQPFREVAKAGPIPLGGAVLTSAGDLPFRAIVHVAGIDLLWRASEASIRGSVRSAMALVNEHGFRSVAFPVLGAGSGGFPEDAALGLVRDELGRVASLARVRIVRYR